MLRFDPFSDLDALTRGLLTSQTGSNRSPRFMPMDLCKIDDHYVLTADLPGVDPGSVDVNVDNGTLTISAHRTARSDESAQWLANERFFGTYRRQLSLGDGVDSAAISATSSSENVPGSPVGVARNPVEVRLRLTTMLTASPTV